MNGTHERQAPWTKSEVKSKKGRRVGRKEDETGRRNVKVKVKRRYRDK